MTTNSHGTPACLSRAAVLGRMSSPWAYPMLPVKATLNRPLSGMSGRGTLSAGR